MNNAMCTIESIYVYKKQQAPQVFCFVPIRLTFPHIYIFFVHDGNLRGRDRYMIASRPTLWQPNSAFECRHKCTHMSDTYYMVTFTRAIAPFALQSNVRGSGGEEDSVSYHHELFISGPKRTARMRIGV